MKSVKYSKIGLETETDLDQSSTLSIRKLWLFIIVTSIVIGLIFSTVYHVYQDEIGSKFKECNPFLQLGRLHLDETLVQGADARPSSETIWEPYNQECKPSRFMNDFYKLRNPEIAAVEKEKKVESSGIQSNSTAISADKLDWIKNKTIFLIGDSIDRWTIRDMCHLLRGEAFVVDYNHPSSPPPYHLPHTPFFDPSTGIESKVSLAKEQKQLEMEAKWLNQTPGMMSSTSPWVCNVKEYNFTILTLFTFGLEGADELFENDHGHHGPASSEQRLIWIGLPLLQNIAKLLNRPQILKPDLIQLHSGFWDLRQWSMEDLATVPWDPYRVKKEISHQREEDWKRRSKSLIRFVSKTFDAKTITWRIMNMPRSFMLVPRHRVAPLNELARVVIEELQQEKGLSKRLRINEWGRLMTGMEEEHNRPKDELHQNPSGSFIHGSTLLYELERASRI